ncbi:MAG TPA: RNA polymerase sigma factor [Phycisphaerae bacterium]|nr:RNA polymerase sigma factor [Phycisphaerae bacterium]
MAEWITTTTVLHDLRDFENRAAWDRFDSRFRRPIVNFAVSVGLAPSDAEDVAQESLLTFAEAYRGGRYERTRGRLSQWLFGIAYRKALDQRRRSARGAGSGSSEVNLWMAENLPDETAATVSWDREWEQALLEQCLEQVRREVEPSTYRAFELVVRENQDAAEAAAVLGVNIKLVYNAKHRILKRIRELRTELESVA